MSEVPRHYGFQSRFAIGHRVKMDASSLGEDGLVGLVTAVNFRSHTDYILEVSWLHNGTAQSAWFQPWRLSDGGFSPGGGRKPE